MTPLKAFLTKSVLDFQTQVVDNNERKVPVKNQQKIPKEMRDTPSGVPKMHRNPKSTLLRNELFLVPFGIPGIWYSLWWMLCMVWHVLLCNGIISQKRNGKEEGKFWGTTAAPIQSSSSLGARLAYAFRATRYEVIEYQNRPRNLHSESQKLHQEIGVDIPKF